MTTEFVFPSPASMTASEAATWYRSMVPMIPKIRIDTVFGDNERELRVSDFKSHWSMKARLRLAAALAMYDPGLVEEFFDGFPLPSANHFLGEAFAACEDESAAFDWAKSRLLEVTQSERRMFPGTIGEAIGLECRASDGVYVMTESGWNKKA